MYTYLEENDLMQEHMLYRMNWNTVFQRVNVLRKQ